MAQMLIELSNEQIQVLGEALQEMPFKKSAPLITHINNEIQLRHKEQQEEILKAKDIETE